VSFALHSRVGRLGSCHVEFPSKDFAVLGTAAKADFGRAAGRTIHVSTTSSMLFMNDDRGSVIEPDRKGRSPPGVDLRRRNIASTGLTGSLHWILDRGRPHLPSRRVEPWGLVRGLTLDIHRPQAERNTPRTSRKTHS